MDPAQQLIDIQRQISTAQETVSALMDRRAELIGQARTAGMTNREIASVLGIKEPNVYRIENRS